VEIVIGNQVDWLWGRDFYLNMFIKSYKKVLEWIIKWNIVIKEV